MTEGSDADRIQRERDRRRLAERARVEEERHARQLELERLRLLDSSHAEDAARSPLRGRGDTGDPMPGAAEKAAGPTPPTETGTEELGPTSVPPREVGGPIAVEGVNAFLAVDPSERFDIQALNAIRFAGLVPRVGDDPRLLRALAERAETLMVRVKQEVDDSLSAGAFLRERVLEWYRRSPEDPGWGTRMPPRWAGIFTDSRVSGGKLVPWLNSRLWALREKAARARGLSTRIRRSLLRDRGGDAAITRTAGQQIQAEVAQSILDDLATKVRDAELPLPLVRLSELAVRRQVQTVNDALAALFASPETGPFVILHPNRYPDCEQVDIRPPAPGASGAALAYSLSPVRSARRGALRSGTASAGSDAGPGSSVGSLTGADAEADLDAATVWEAETVSAATWVRVVDERRRERHRLDPPPKDYRAKPAWPVLTSLVLENADFRKAFLSAKWRGRPSGLPLVAQLLQKGSFAPEVATDHEYLEAELGELVQGDPQWRPAEGVWHVGEWTISRDGSHHEGFRYRAESGPPPKSG